MKIVNRASLSRKRTYARRPPKNFKQIYGTKQEISVPPVEKKSEFEKQGKSLQPYKRFAIGFPRTALRHF